MGSHFKDDSVLCSQYHYWISPGLQIKPGKNVHLHRGKTLSICKQCCPQFTEYASCFFDSSYGPLLILRNDMADEK
jgi:hypothetical protein